MKDINLNLNTKLSVMIGLVVLVLMALVLGWSFKELSTIRRDLYAVRSDYYGGGIDEDYASQVDFTLLSQEVKDLRVADMSADLICPDEDPMKGECEYAYKRTPVRVLELSIKNNQDYVYSYYDSLAATDSNGVLKHSVQVHEDDNQNEYYRDYGNLELAPGGQATVYIYLEDDGTEITSLYDIDMSTEVKLN